jgi:hypothetical protein
MAGILQLRHLQKPPRAQVFCVVAGKCRRAFRRYKREVELGEVFRESRQQLIWRKRHHWLSPTNTFSLAGNEALNTLLTLQRHVVPTLGDAQLQKLTSSDIDRLYAKLAGTMAKRTLHHVHTVLGTLLANPPTDFRLERSRRLRA